ncbi:uncharacterized protein [Centruroides vittatus]|uniref:uncharacterized protein isoform X2 n=1 Tax=Centruroides vittatus TaxID=120091 RepID=UPI00350FA9A9
MQSSLKTLFMLLCLSYECNGKSFNCSLENFQKCMASLQAVTQSEKLAFATTREELKDVCLQLQEGFYCVENHSKKCFSSSQKRLFDSVVSGSRNVIEDLCVPGIVQEKYLRYAKCFKNVSTDERKCATQYHRMVHLSEYEEDTKSEVEDGLKETCCAFTEFVHCKYIHAVRDCGQDAGDFLQNHMDRMSGSLIHQHCSLYTFQSDACTTASATTLTTDQPWMLPVIILAFKSWILL